jgi:hypothetical protein
MKQIFGENWHTSLAGYLLAGLMVAEQMVSEGVVNPWRIALAVGIAVLGRVAGDSKPKE